MNNLICLRHPHYDAKTPPELSCKTCCSMYIKEIKITNEAKTAKRNPETTTSQWIREKRSQAAAYTPESI